MADPRSSHVRSRGRRSAIGFAAAATTLALGLAGCGQAGSSSSGLSRADLVKRADPICKRHFEKIATAANKVLAGGRLPNPREFGRLAQQTIIPEYTRQISELRTLKPADDAAPRYKSWLDASDATLARIKSNPALITDATNFKGVNAQGDRLGLATQCRVGPT